MAALSARPFPMEALPDRAASVVCAAGLDARVGGHVVLRSISVEIRAASITALLGANGAGKSTLLRMFASLLTPVRGTLTLFGGPAGAPAARARVGMVAHQLMLYRDLTAVENVEFFARLYGVADARGRAMDALEAVGLADRAGRRISALSRGMAQRVAIARAVVHGPALLLADEPYGGLDDAAMARVDACLRDLRARGCAVVLTGHGLDDCRGMADRVVVLRDGGLVMDVPVAGLDEGAVRRACGGGA